MANHKATGKKAKHAGELIQRIRAGILNAFDAVEQDGTKISDILADEFRNNPLKFMDMASKHLPKEMHIAANDAISEMSDADIADRIVEIRDELAARASGKESSEGESSSVH